LVNLNAFLAGAADTPPEQSLTKGGKAKEPVLESPVPPPALFDFQDVPTPRRQQGRPPDEASPPQTRREDPKETMQEAFIFSSAVSTGPVQAAFLPGSFLETDSWIGGLALCLAQALLAPNREKKRTAHCSLTQGSDDHAN